MRVEIIGSSKILGSDGGIAVGEPHWVLRNQSTHGAEIMGPALTQDGWRLLPTPVLFISVKLEISNRVFRGNTALFRENTSDYALDMLRITLFPPWNVFTSDVGCALRAILCHEYSRFAADLHFGSQATS